MKGANPKERKFGWKMCQDMLEVGDRLHRKGSNKVCSWIQRNGVECKSLETVEHRLFLCERVRAYSNALIEVVKRMIGHDIDRKEILFLNFNVRNRGVLNVCIWFVVKAFHLVFKGKVDQLMIWKDISKEIVWSIENSDIMLDFGNMDRIKGIIDDMFF